MVTPWPRPDRRATNPVALRRFAVLEELVGAIRSIRAEYSVPPGQAVRATVSNPGADLTEILQNDHAIVRRMAKLSTLEAGRAEAAAGAGTASAVLSNGSSIAIPLGDLVDLAKECARLKSEADRLAEVIQRQDAKLANPEFVARAPAQVVEREREKLASWQEQVAVLTEKRRKLGCDAGR
jgi:valyl-tRNA synthetase